MQMAIGPVRLWARVQPSVLASPPPELHLNTALGSAKGSKVECAPQTARRSLRFAWLPALLNTSENQPSDTNGERLSWDPQTLLGLLQCY